MNQKTNGGTPKNLDQAIYGGLCVGPLCDVVDRTKAHVRDYLAQKFGVAMLKAHTPEQEALICELWTAVTGEDCSRLGGKK